ncbi:MAG: TRAP transporter large permease subunit, partial [Gemmatimonadales bacterium]
MAAHYEIGLAHIGIVFLANLELGYLTPPVGMNLFLSALTFDRPLLKI